MDQILIIPKLIENKNNKFNINPLFEKIKKESNKYITKKLCNSNEVNFKYFDNNLSYWSSICYPNIIIEDKIYNITNFYTLLFIIDDILENNINTNINSIRYIEILEDIIEPITKIEKTFKNIWCSIKKDLSIIQKTRFINYIKEWMDGAKYLSNFNNNIDRNTYMYYRFKSIGAMASFITIEYGFDIEFTQETLYLLKDIHNISGQNIILINDLFSYRKEIYENKNNINIINIIISQNNCSLQDAINLLEIDIKKNYNNFKKLYNEILVNNDDKNIRKYLNGLSDLIIGNLHWSCISPRYHGINFKSTLINGAKVIFDKNETIIVKS